MAGWNVWLDKKVYIILADGRRYEGKVIDVDNSSEHLTFITINDKYNRRVTFSVGEIKLIKEEDEQEKLK